MFYESYLDRLEAEGTEMATTVLEVLDLKYNLLLELIAQYSCVESGAHELSAIDNFRLDVTRHQLLRQFDSDNWELDKLMISISTSE